MLSLAIPTSLLLGSVYSKMELSQLKYFVAIANHGSFTKAAEPLYVT
ncbi:LysR family transcriptional regulator [Acaryochloris marina NIES-2412]